jgi:hypothetical protein
MTEHERAHRPIDGMNMRSRGAVRSVELEDATTLALRLTSFPSETEL